MASLCSSTRTVTVSSRPLRCRLLAVRNIAVVHQLRPGVSRQQLEQFHVPRAASGVWQREPVSVPHGPEDDNMGKAPRLATCARAARGLPRRGCRLGGTVVASGPEPNVKCATTPPWSSTRSGQPPEPLGARASTGRSTRQSGIREGEPAPPKASGRNFVPASGHVTPGRHRVGRSAPSDRSGGRDHTLRWARSPESAIGMSGFNGIEVSTKKSLSSCFVNLSSHRSRETARYLQIWRTIWPV